jgi:hypothetical protein
MGRYCDICGVDDKEHAIGFLETNTEWHNWCSFDLEVCHDCATNIKNAIQKEIDRLKGEK